MSLTPDDESPPDLPILAIRTTASFPIERRRLPDDPELAPDLAIVGAFLDGRMIARAGLPMEWDSALDAALFHAPRPIEYHARDSKAGQAIHAQLYAVIPADAIPPEEPWMPRADADAEPVLLELGVVVRLAGDRGDRSFQDECVDHLNAILSGNAKPAADRALEILLG